MGNARALDWLHQAEQDYLWAEDSLDTGHFYGVCFLSQQIAEKSLKAVAFARGYDQIKSHSVVSICASLEINGNLEDMGKILDQYYISTRYPDGLPSGHAGMFFTKEQAIDALKKCRAFLDYAISKVQPDRL